MTIQNENVSTLWPITLFGFMIFVGLFFFSALISPLLSESNTVSAFTMCFALLLINCAFINILFCFTTLSVFWEKLSFPKTVMYFLALIVFNFLSCYLFAKLWKEHSEIDIYSFKGKRAIEFSKPLNNPLYIIFAFFTLISVVVPLFIASQR